MTACTGRTANGHPCKGQVQFGDTECWHHLPEATRSARRAAKKKDLLNKPKFLFCILAKLVRTYEELEAAMDGPAWETDNPELQLQVGRKAVTEVLERLDMSNTSARLRLLGDAAIPDTPEELYEKPKGDGQ